MTDFASVVKIIYGLVTTMIPVVGSLALFSFFWGIVRFITNAGDVKGNQAGKDLMVWGLAALFVMVSVWGILRFIYADLGLPGAPAFGIPFLPTS